jgi:MoaA/NifB/PqqE/SkfB family radical SAM enzyme
MMTNLCNARCVHCDIWKNKGREDVPSLDELKLVLSDLRRWLGPAPVYFSGGEALLRPYAVEVVAHSAAIGLFTEILTHGYWDDQSRIEKLALARPSRITVSLDAVGEVHSLIRGRDHFFEKTARTLETLLRVRQENRLPFVLRLKTVIMRQNLDQVHRVAEFAQQHGAHVFYQAIEQNYNTPEDPRWFEHSENWPRDPNQAVATVDRLIGLKRSGLPIANSYAQLEAMKPYFRNPDSVRVSIQSHSAHERRAVCSALTNLQILPNGDVLSCYGMAVIGNIRHTPIRRIWESRPPWWEGGCCLERRCTPAEKETLALTSIGTAC